MENLDEVLKSEPEQEAPEPIVTPPSDIVDPPSDRVRDEKGRFAKKDETGVEPQPQAPVESEAPPAPQSQLPPDIYEPLKAVRNENKELKRQLEMIQRQMQAPPQPRQPTPEFWDDPQGFMSAEMSRFGETLLQQWEQRQQIQRIDASEKAVRAKYADYDEAYQAFEQAVQANPRLAYELAQSDDPGEFAYSKGKAALAIQSVGSLDALKAQIRSEIEAELKAAIPQPKPVLPSTTAADGSVGGRSGPSWSGPTPLTQILG
jgi:hypothetical protein